MQSCFILSLGSGAQGRRSCCVHARFRATMPAALKGRAASVPLRMSGCVNIDSAAGAQLVSLLRKVLANVRASE